MVVVTCHVQYVMFKVPIFHVSTQLVFPIDFNYLDWVLQLDSIIFIFIESYDLIQLVLFGDLNKLSLIPYSL